MFNQGDFVFAKMRGYRSWPARILELEGEKYNVFFYGTCNTAKLKAGNLFPYETYRLGLGDLQNLRQKEFKRSVLHADRSFANPIEDYFYNETISKLQINPSLHCVVDEYNDDEYDFDYDDDYDDDYFNDIQPTTAEIEQ